ncbi:MAG: hypothetical protein V3T31_00535 [candidate division Zixibacteria bacterium]
MISLPLMLSCLGAGFIYLAAVSFVLELIERKMKLTASLPKEALEEVSWVWFGMNLVLETLFFVAIPAIGYSFLYFSLPFTGIRGGLAVALFALVVGAAPTLMSLSVKIKLPQPFIFFTLLSYLIKIGGTLSIIAFLYSL